MKQPITVRIDLVLLAMAKRQAGKANRTQTNLIETPLKRQIQSATTLGRALAPRATHELDWRSSGRVSRKQGGTGNLE